MTFMHCISKTVKQFYLSIFSDVGEHDHSSTLSVVDHLPHVPSSALHGALSYDVRLLLLVALHIVTQHELIEMSSHDEDSH